MWRGMSRVSLINANMERVGEPPKGWTVEGHYKISFDLQYAD